MSGTAHRRPYVVAIDLVSVALYATAMIGWAVAFVPPTDATLMVVVAVFAAALVADFGSGAFHWAADTWGTPQWPFVGKAFIAPFREHHTDQLAITRHGFLEVNGASCFLAFPVAFLAWGSASEANFASVFFPALAVFMFATNQLHKWAHSASVPRVVGWLQRRGLVLSPQHHAVHHRFPHHTNYCITLGWMNPVLDRLRFWRAIERVVVWLTRGRAQPARNERPANMQDGGGPWAGRSGRSRAASG